MWTEDRRARAPIPFRATDGAPLDCFGPLPALPPAAAARRAGGGRPRRGPPPGTTGWRSSRARRWGPGAAPPCSSRPGRCPRSARSPGTRASRARAGFDVWTLVPPRHLRRAAPGARSGEGFVSPDLPALRAALEQLVVELRVLCALARARGGETALVGLSLGALGAALAATAPERVDRAALLAPPADLAAVFSETAIGRRYLRLAARAGAPAATGAALADMLAPFRPDLRRPATRGDPPRGRVGGPHRAPAGARARARVGDRAAALPSRPPHAALRLPRAAAGPRALPPRGTARRLTRERRYFSSSRRGTDRARSSPRRRTRRG